MLKNEKIFRNRKIHTAYVNRVFISSNLCEEMLVSDSFCRTFPEPFWATLTGGFWIWMIWLLHRLENVYGCPYDFIEIFDGPQSESFSLGRFCSNATPIFTSSSNRLTVVFHSDAIITNIGFYATYESLVQDENDTGRSFGHLSPWPCLVMVVRLDGRACLGSRN